MRNLRVVPTCCSCGNLCEWTSEAYATHFCRFGVTQYPSDDDPPSIYVQWLKAREVRPDNICDNYESVELVGAAPRSWK